MVYRLELRDLLRAITASVCKMMQCRAVGVMLSDSKSNELGAFYRGKPGFLPNAGPRRRVRLTCPVADP